MMRCGMSRCWRWQWARVISTAPSGDGSSTASWTFSGLTPGATYQVAVAWQPDYSNSSDAPFTVLDGSQQLAVVRVNQRGSPNSAIAWSTIFL